jgi:hypothetical protein
MIKNSEKKGVTAGEQIDYRSKDDAKTCLLLHDTFKVGSVLARKTV